MKRQRRWDPSILQRYMLSYFSIALLSCCLIGVLFFQAMARQMELSQLEIQQKKLNQAVEDFAVQLDLLQGISHRISVDWEFRPTYFRTNKFYETELLRSLAKFTNNSPFAADYFLYYHDSDLVYRSNGKSNQLSYFIGQYLKEDPANFPSLLRSADQMTVLPQPTLNRFLLVYPVKIRQGSSRASLCFLLTEEEMERRLEAVTGGLEGNLRLELASSLLLAGEPEPPGRLHALESASGQGLVRARLEIPAKSLTGGRNIVGIFNAATVILVSLIIIVTAAFLAWRSYLPIRRFHKRVTGERGKGQSQNELHEIERAFETLRQSNREANDTLLRQWGLLRDQLLRGLLNGDDPQGSLVRLKLLGMELAGPYYMVFCLRLEASDNGQEAEAVDNLSGNGLRFYGVPTGAWGDFAVICSLEEEYQALEAEELLGAMLEARGEPASLGRGGVYATADQIAASYLEAASGLRHRAPGEGQAVEFDAGILLRLLSELRAGSGDAVAAGLDAFERHLDDCAPSPLIQKYTYSQIIGLLVQATRDWDVPAEPSMLSNLLTARDNHAFREGVEDILSQLGDSLSKRRQDGEDLSTRVLRYLREHYLDYELSLDSMAEHFHVTATYLGKCIKRSTGITYKAYVTGLRMDEAKRLLAEGCSVADTGNRLGYSSTSHFIRVFRQAEDVTPSVFQKQQRSESR